MYPSVTQKRNWLHRESLQQMLQSLGLPAVMDSSHIVFKGGVDQLVYWLVASSDLSGLLGTPEEAKMIFTQLSGAVSVSHLESPGISFRGVHPVVDGAAMKLRFAQHNANEGPVGYIVPVRHQMMRTGEEWNEHVALIPKTAIEPWMRLVNAADTATRFISQANMMMEVYNGGAERISPMTLNDIIMDDYVKTSIVNDVKGFLDKKESFQKRRLPWTRKYLFNGPAGTGKTSLARWMATELGLTPVSFDFTDRYADGRTFKNFLSWAQRKGPAVVILDDFEKVLASENRTGITGHTLLTALSGMGSTDGLIFVVTSNSTEPFNGPMRRRFDMILEVPLPGPDLRMKYLKRQLVEDDVDDGTLQSVVRSSSNWSYDDLRGLIAAALNLADTERIGNGDIIAAMKLITARRGESINA
jgi:AAA+ superfamily predicted ATPase